ncbi:MAG: hypothetical protein IPN79_17545 [Saprospiraceae bacterium]|nr:hypothetical protein [Saprospiraceae bacterium]
MKLVVLAMFCIFFSCQNKKEPVAAEMVVADTLATSLVGEINDVDSVEIDVEDATMWLKEVVESHFLDGGFPMEDICTPEYYSYKTDATQVGYEGGYDRRRVCRKMVFYL